MRMNIKAVLTAAMICVVLVAGGAQAQGGGDTRKMAENVAKIQIGKSSSKDVEALLGKPDRVTRNNRKSHNEWGYSLYADGKRGTLWVMMTDDGVVREVFQVMDRRMGTT
jgi:hypothetical protein